MVKFYQKTHEYPESPATPLLAFFLRYPNPFARHVLSVDVLSRTVNPETGQIHTTRLILKRGIIPKWANRWLPTTSSSGGRGLDAWVLEESVVDPPGWGGEADDEYRMQPKLSSQQGNLNHRKFMHIIEGSHLHAGPSGNTIHRTTAEVRSNLGGAWSNFMRQRIESYGIGKFEVNTETARKGMALVMDLLRTRQPLPDTAEFYPPPPPSFGESWSKPNSNDPSDVSPSRGSPSSFFLSPEMIASLTPRRSSTENNAESNETKSDT